MEVKTSYTYNFEDSCKRIDDMLATSGDFEETVDIKKRVNLTYDNGYYVNCYALFVDIRDSSSLPSASLIILPPIMANKIKAIQ